MKKITLFVQGMHCGSCKILIEDILSEDKNFLNVSVDLKKETVFFETPLEKNETELVNILAKKFEQNNYYFSTTSSKKRVEKKDDAIWQAIPLGIFILGVFFILQKTGILNVGFGGEITPFTSFFIGLIASVSSCLAVVGGFILSLSAKLAQDNKSSTKTLMIFHASRIVSFGVLGGILGILGASFGINFFINSLLGIFASLVMIFLGMNIIGLIKKNIFTLPAGISSVFRGMEHHIWAPLFLGFGTFFLPCGFTQSMQIQALSSGSFLGGFSILFFFALGTLPVLGLLSFSSLSFSQSKFAPLFFKTAGIVVVGLGIFSLLSGLSALGIFPPLFSV